MCFQLINLSIDKCFEPGEVFDGKVFRGFVVIHINNAIFYLYLNIIFCLYQGLGAGISYYS